MHGEDNVPGRPGRDMTPAKAGMEDIELSRRQWRLAEVGLVAFLGLVVWWPLAILVVAFVIPTMVILSVIAAAVAAVGMPTRLLVRVFRARHRARHFSRLLEARAAVMRGHVPVRHLRPRAAGLEQPITTVELFFDLVYVFAVTQLSHMILSNLTVGEVARAALLLLIVWWAWIYTTWMANWFDPTSAAVRGVLTGVMLASLLMAAALPGAFGGDGFLFAVSYVTLQVGRNAAAARLLGQHTLREVFDRLLGWSVASGVLWLAGAALAGDRRLLLWIPAVALDLCAPFAGYWLPRRGHAVTTDYDIDGGHFTDRCQGFIIIALGESIVVTGATAAHAGLTSAVVVALGVAFVETAALWWLYFGAVAAGSREVMRSCEDPGRLARDAFTYLHAPIVAGIIAVAVGDDLLIAAPRHALHGVGLAMVLGGPVLYLLSESLFRLRMTGAANAKRVAVAAILVLLGPIGSQMSALALSAAVAGLLGALALWELRMPARRPLGTRLGPSTDARGTRLGDLGHVQQHQEGSS